MRPPCDARPTSSGPPSPTRGSASTRSRRTTSPPLVARLAALGLRRERRLARRVGARPAGRHPERADHARGHRQDRRRPARGRPRRRGRRAAPLGGGRVGRRGRASSARLARRARARRRRAPPAQPVGRAGDAAGLAVGAGLEQVRAGRRRGGGSAIEAGGGADGPLRWRGHPPPRRIPARGGRRLADAVRRAPRAPRPARGGLPDFDTLDVGGGFPVGARPTPAPRPERFARELPALLAAIPADRRPGRLAIEPGRVLVAGRAGSSARVLHVRERGGRMVVLDAGMTELIRPALYGPSTRSSRSPRSGGRSIREPASPPPRWLERPRRRPRSDLRVDRHARRAPPAAAPPRRPRRDPRRRRLRGVDRLRRTTAGRGRRRSSSRPTVASRSPAGAARSPPSARLWR